MITVVVITQLQTIFCNIYTQFCAVSCELWKLIIKHNKTINIKYN